MRKKGIFLILLVLAFLAGCSGQNDDGSGVTNAAVPNNYFDQTATLQGTIFDAITGNRLTDASLKVTLVRGTTYQAASTRTGVTMDHFPGDYALTGIPLAINGNTTYRIAVTVDGYQPFESAITLNAGAGGTLDKNYNFLGNVYMFPVGVPANDVKVNVAFNGEPVEGATVLLQARMGGNTVTADTTNLLVGGASNGFQGSISATTDVNGIATFAGSTLVLGGQYRINVLQLSYEGIPLVQIGAAITINIGASVVVQNVTMGDISPSAAAADEGLYIVSASNTDINKIQSDGVLTLVFSRPVSFVNETEVLATITTLAASGASNSAAINATNAPDSGVNGSLSSDGLTLTLSPVYTTPPVAFNGTNASSADNRLRVTYSSLNVRLVQANDTGSTYSVFTALFDETGGFPSGTVWVTPQF